MNLYETGFLIAPNLSDEESEAFIQQMAEVIAARNGKLIRTEKWGKRRLAYRLKKHGEAGYVFFHYEALPDAAQELARRLRQSESVLRYLTVRKEDAPNVRSKRKARNQARREEARAAAAQAAAESAPVPESETADAGESRE